MKFHSSPARRQGGFIQGTILFALAILGVIIAAFAVSNTGSNTNTDTERDRVNAGVIIKSGSDLQDAVARAMADNWAPSVIETTEGTAPGTVVPTRLWLFDLKYKYAVEPRVPEQAFSGTPTKFALDNMHTLGDAATKERIAKLPGLKKSVCQRINAMVQSEPWDANAEVEGVANVIVATPAEGCYKDGTDYIYFRVVSVDGGGA
jgi:hypothetical protein